MPNPNTNFKNTDGTDLGNILITKEYLMTVYPQIANQLITPELWNWGYNAYAALGINNTAGRTTPVTTFAGGANWKQASCGQQHTTAIKTDGTLWTWGYNAVGQLAINSAGQTTGRSTPVQTFAGGTNWKQVSCGVYHTAAIKTDGTLWTWGYNNRGQLGVNDTNTRCTPVVISSGATNWKQVSCGGYHTAAIKTDGTLWTWGDNTTGQLGVNDTTNRNTPVVISSGATNWKQVGAGGAYSFPTGNGHIAAIKTDGTLWTWGLNTYGQLGVNDTNTRCTPVVISSGATNWKQVSSGANHIAAIKTDGTLWTWGLNSSGQLGVNDTNGRTTPVQTFAGGTNWKQVDCGGSAYTTLAIKTDGTLWTWGYNLYGQLGINNTTDKITPVTTFAGGTEWKQATPAVFHTVAIQTSDDLTGI